MNRRKAQAEAEALNENYDKAKALYGTLVGLTESPSDAADIILMMHMLLFLNTAAEGVSVDVMLQSYTHLFKTNWEAQMAAAKETDGTLN